MTSRDDKHHEDAGAEARRADLARIAAEQADAVWAPQGEQTKPSLRGLGLFSGDIGPKGDISGRLRALSVEARRSRDTVPRGTVAPGTGRYIFATVALIALGGLGLLALLGWALA